MDNSAVKTHAEHEENGQANQQLLPAPATHLIPRTHSHHTQLAQYDGTVSLSPSPSMIVQLANRDERRPSRGLFYEYVFSVVVVDVFFYFNRLWPITGTSSYLSNLISIFFKCARSRTTQYDSITSTIMYYRNCISLVLFSFGSLHFHRALTRA